jgi:hypothetical protein
MNATATETFREMATQCPDVQLRCALESTLVALGYATFTGLALMSDREVLNLYRQAFVAFFGPTADWTCPLPTE